MSPQTISCAAIQLKGSMPWSENWMFTYSILKRKQIYKYAHRALCFYFGTKAGIGKKNNTQDCVNQNHQLKTRIKTNPICPRWKPQVRLLEMQHIFHNGYTVIYLWRFSLVGVTARESFVVGDWIKNHQPRTKSCDLLRNSSQTIEVCLLPNLAHKTFSMKINIFTQLYKLFTDTSETQCKRSFKVNRAKTKTWGVQPICAPLSVLQQRELLCRVIVLLNLTIKGSLILALHYTNSPVAWREDIKTGQNSARGKQPG